MAISLTGVPTEADWIVIPAAVFVEAHTRVSQVAIENFSFGTNQARLSQVAIEVWVPNSVSPERVSQVAIENFSYGTNQLRVSQVAVEVWVPNKKQRFPPHMIMWS